MKNKNEVTGNLLLGCTVLRITPEFPGAVTTCMNAGIGSRACRLHVPARILVLPREIPELYAKPYSLTVNFQSLHFYFSCMHSARMLRSTGKYNTDCAILSCNVSIERLYERIAQSVLYLPVDLSMRAECMHEK